MNYIVVTGANGFLGSAIVKELNKQGKHILAVVRNENSDIASIKNLSNITIIYNELQFMCELSEKINHILTKDDLVDAFFHMAWEGSAGEQRGNFFIQYQNIKAACDAIEVSRKIHCNRFIYPSSVSSIEFGVLYKKKIDVPLHFMYGIAKMTADYMAHALANQNHIVYISAMVSNVYGVGEWSSRLVSNSIKMWLTDKVPDFSSGNQPYDFIYIQDAAEAFIALGEKGMNNKTYYIGNGRIMPLKKYLYMMRDAVNPKLAIGIGNRNSGGGIQ